MTSIKGLFQSDCDRFDGIRPINIYGMRLVYLLMATLLAFDVWRYILTNQQQWNPGDAMNWSVWAAFTLFAAIGMFRTVEMIPILLLEITYKTIWLILVALPLLLHGDLTEDTTDGMIAPFAMVILPIAVIPWGYVLRKYLAIGKTR